MLPKVADDAVLSFDADFSLGAKGEDFPAADLLWTWVESVLGAEPFENGFLGACLGIGGNGADDGVDFSVEFFSDEIEVTVSLFLPVENGFVGAVFDEGGKAAAAPALRFIGPSFNSPLSIEVGSEVASFFFMSIAALNFSGVVPKLARVSREAFDNVVCFKSRGAFNDNWFIRFLSIVDGLSQPLLAFVLEGGENMLILFDTVRV
jgi:hypothetical protein